MRTAEPDFEVTKDTMDARIVVAGVLVAFLGLGPFVVPGFAEGRGPSSAVRQNHIARLYRTNDAFEEGLLREAGITSGFSINRGGPHSLDTFAAFLRWSPPSQAVRIPGSTSHGSSCPSHG